MKKIYIEISDICGLKCDFCPAPKGVRGVMDLVLFRKAVLEARHFTRLITLHILGDPLKIGNLAEYLQIAKEANLSVEITTSGANLSDFDLLLRAPIKQVNFSLDAIRTLKNAPFLLRRICDFCKYKVQKKSEIFINLRVQKRAENAEIVEFLAQNLVQNNRAQSANFESRPLRGAKNREEGRSSASADFLLEAEKRGTLPKSEKRQLLGTHFKKVGESGERGAALLREKTSEISGNGIAESKRDSSVALLPQNDNFIDCHADSANLLAMTENKDFAEYTLDSANLQNLAQNRIKLGNKIIIDFREVFEWNIEDNAKIAESRADSATRTQEANSKIVDEFLWFCGALAEAKKDAEFGTCLALKTHIGILADGTIVPCCIDALGNLALGNIKEISLDSALKGARAQKMLCGFRENRLVEHFCQKCDYKNRFT